MAMGGPAGLAIGRGIGTLASGGDLEDAFKSGVMGFMGGQGGPMGGIMNAFGQGGGGNQFSQIASLLGNQGGGGGRGASPLAQLLSSTVPGGMGGGQMNQGGIAGIMNAMNNQGGGGRQNRRNADISNLINATGVDSPLGMAALIYADTHKGNLTTPLQQAQMDTGERMPNFRGIGFKEERPGRVQRRYTRDINNRPAFAQGGLIEGPGTGTSDSIPGMIMQNGKPVEEILVSNEEFILRAKDVEKIGEGDRDRGAAKLYAMQRRFDNGGTMNG